MFSICLNKLEEHIIQYGSFLKSFDSVIVNCHNAVINLTENGFIGKSQFACMESFNVWINTCKDLYKRMYYEYEVLRAAYEQAVQIKTMYHQLPQSLGGSAEGTNPSFGYLSLGDDNLSSQATSVGCNELARLQHIITSIENNLSDMYFNDGGVSGDCCKLKIMCRDEGFKLNDFAKAYDLYSRKVKDLDANLASRLVYAVDSNFSLIKGLEKILDITSAVSYGISLGAIKSSQSLKEFYNVSGIAVVDGKYLRISGHKQGQGLGNKYIFDNLKNYPKANALYNAGRLEKASTIAGKVNKVATGLTVAIGAGSAIYEGINEYGRNPYLPDDKRNSDAIAEGLDSAVETTVAFTTTTLSAKTGATIGAAVGSSAGVVGALPGAVVGAGIGLVAGWFGSYIINEKAITDDALEGYKEWRYDQVTSNANDYYKWSPNYEAN